VTDDNWIVVHIADPARWFDVAHPVHDIAFRRVSSVYLPERTIPMFPPALSENLFSLAASQTKPVLSFSVRLGEDGSIVESRISPGVVHNVVRLTYDEVDAMLENASGQADAPMSRSLQLLNTLAQRRAAYRKNKGAMAVDLPQCEPRVDTESGKISINIERSYRSLSHVLVQEWMVVAGELAAQFAHGNGIPIPYRTQQPSATPLPAALFSASTVIDTPSMRNFAAAQSTYSMDELSNIVKGSIAVRNMSPAVAQAEPGAHAGLGLACYAHTTSPIRRYGDLVVAAQVKAFLASAPLPFSRDTIAGLVCPQMERVSIHIAKLQRESQRFWALHYVDSLFRAAVPKKEKLVFNALITGLDASVQRGIYGADVMLLELGLRWKVDVSGDGFNVGDVLRVQVHEVFPDRAFLQLMPIT
jgi:exoribonuclease-2